MPVKLNKRVINVNWEDFEGNPQKLILRRPRTRDMKHIRRSMLPFHAALEKMKKDPNFIDEKIADIDVEMVRILVNRLKESSTVPLDSEDDWSDMDAGDLENMKDKIFEECDYFLPSSQDSEKV